MAPNELCDNFASLDSALNLDYNKTAEDLIGFQNSKAIDLIDIESIISGDIHSASNQNCEPFQSSPDYPDFYGNIMQPSISSVTHTLPEANDMNTKENLLSNTQVIAYKV